MANIENLPSEILGLCFDDCTLRQLLRCSQVSRRWRSVAHAHPLFWRNVELRHHQRGGGVFLFVERLNASPGLDIEVTLLSCDARAMQAVIANMHRITGLTLGRDELRILRMFQCPAPALRTLNLCGGLFSAAQYPVGPNLAPFNFLGGHAPILHTVSLDNCSLLFSDSSFAPCPSVTRVSVNLTGIQRSFLLFGYSGVVLLNSIARLFPNSRLLAFSLGCVPCSSRNITDELPPSWRTTDVAPATMQWFQLLSGFHSRGYASYYLPDVPVYTIPDVSMQLLSIEQLWLLPHSVPPLTTLVPLHPFCLRIAYRNGIEEVSLVTFTGVRRRFYGPPVDTVRGMDLGWFVEAARDTLVALSTDSIGLCHRSLSRRDGAVIATLRVLVLEIAPWDNQTLMSIDPADPCPALPNLRRLILSGRHTAQQHHDSDVELPWTFLERLTDFFDIAPGVILELRGVSMPDRDPAIVAQNIPQGFANVIIDEDKVSSTETDWLLNLQRVLSAL